MKKMLVVVLIASLYHTVFAANSGTWSNAALAYNKNNLNSLAELYTNNHQDLIIGYLNANANLARTNPNPALEFIQTNSDSYFKNDILHQLLTYFFNTQNWPQYLKTYEQLPGSEVSSNESCGYDIANFAQNNHQPLKSDLKYLITNKMPLWCISLIASKLNDGSLDKSYRQPFLYSLITNDQLYQFNQLSDTFKYPKVNFQSNIPSNKLTNQYQIVYRINSLSKKSPDIAYHELANSDLNQSSKQYLYNLVATNLAIRQMFNIAALSISQGSNAFLSDDELEWQVRTYLAMNNWQKVFDTINSMPVKLQNKNVWLYWQAYAAGKLGQKTTAMLLLQKIPAKYNYYSLLAQSEMQSSLNLQFRAPASKPTEMEFKNGAQLSFDLYQTGKQAKSSILLRLANQNLYYIIGQSDDQDITAISKKAFANGWSDMAIYAAGHLSRPDASLSFPILFSEQYQKYSRQNGIDPSLAMAVTHQESHFNPNALAFDGGVGLMQLMPDTASYIAKKSGSSNCFKNYECNIKFGTWFLSHLYTKFGGNLIYVTAGYNAGPGRAHRWQQSFANLDNRIQIELIPFKITRDYVQKILTNKAVYDARLDNKQQVNMLQYISQINNQRTTFINDDDNTVGDSSGNISNN